MCTSCWEAPGKFTDLGVRRLGCYCCLPLQARGHLFAIPHSFFLDLYSTSPNHSPETHPYKAVTLKLVELSVNIFAVICYERVFSFSLLVRFFTNTLFHSCLVPYLGHRLIASVPGNEPGLWPAVWARIRPQRVFRAFLR